MKNHFQFPIVVELWPLNCDMLVLQNLFLHPCCFHIHLWLLYHLVQWSSWMFVWPFSNSLHHILTCCTLVVITIHLCQLAVSLNGRNMFCPWTSNYTINSSNVSAIAHPLILWIASDWLTNGSSVGCYPYYRFCPRMKNRMLDLHRSYRLGNHIMYSNKMQLC